MKKKWYWVIGIVVLIAIVILGYPYYLSYENEKLIESHTECYNIFECKKCWVNISVENYPGACSSGLTPCQSSPHIERHNAFVDIINCLCKKLPNNIIEAEIKNKFNTEILDEYDRDKYSNVTVSEICNEELLNSFKIYYE